MGHLTILTIFPISPSGHLVASSISHLTGRARGVFRGGTPKTVAAFGLPPVQPAMIRERRGIRSQPGFTPPESQVVTTVPNFRISHPLAAALLAACSFGSIGVLDAGAQDSHQESQIRAARASWTPTRSSGDEAADRTPTQARRQAPQPKSSRNAKATRPAQRPHTAKSAPRPTGSAAPRLQSPVRLAQHEVPTPPPIPGEIIYETAIADGSCDAIGASCGCDAVGCDAIGACGPSCGCSMCGELPSGRAWRPAITLSLPQDGWISFEGLTVWGDGMDLPPLVTSSPVGTAQGDAGVLTRSGTTTLFGGPNNDLFEDSRSAWRMQFGFWLDRCHTLGVGADFLDIDQEVENFSATSTGDPILARPFFNTLTGNEDAELVALNNGADIQLTGTVAVSAYTEMTGGSVYLRRLTCCNEGCREWLFCGCSGHFCSRSEFRIGYRFMELNEGVRITEDLQNNGTTNIGQFDIFDQFDTKNQFNGVDLAWNHRLVRGYWTLETLVRLGVGNTRHTVNIAGQTTIVDQNDPSNVSRTTENAGLLALSTNSGQFKQDEFSVLPEFNLTLGYQLTDHLKATLGYTGIYWSNVVRPGQHIPTDINPDFLPPAITSSGAARPLFAFDTTDYWVNGLSYGLEYRW